MRDRTGYCPQPDRAGTEKLPDPSVKIVLE